MPIYPVKVRNLGLCASAARGMTISAATNATPIVATLGASNHLQAEERIGVFGVTGNTAANGIWTFKRVTATTFNLVGSVGNGTATLTNAVVAAIMDRTRFMKGHAAAVHAHGSADQIAADLTFAVMGNKSDATDAEILATDATALATYFEDIATADGMAWSVPGATNDGIDEWRQMDLRRWMYLNCSAYTAGAVEVDIHV